MHPVLQAAIDNPRFPEPYDWTNVHIPRASRLRAGTNYLEPLIVMGESRGRPANDNEQRTPWPLYDEYVAERLGRDAVTNSKNWNTAVWIDRIYRVATLPEEALGPSHWIASTLSEEELDGYEPAEIVPPEATAYLSMIAEMERIKRVARGYDLVGTHEASSSNDPTLPTGVEIRADANKILRLLMVGMRGLWKPVKRAIIDHVEMWKLAQGVSRQFAPTAGRQRVLDGLEIAADIRRDVLRWEGCSHRLTGNPCSPLGIRACDLPAHWRTAANDDCRAVNVAARPPWGDPTPGVLF